jgi:hypothetical protein
VATLEVETFTRSTATTILAAVFNPTSAGKPIRATSSRKATSL